MCVRTRRRELEFDRDTYTPLTAEELPSLAVKDLMIAARSALVAGLADELAASARAARVDTSTTTMIATVNDERTITESWRRMPTMRGLGCGRDESRRFSAAALIGEGSGRRSRRDTPC